MQINDELIHEFIESVNWDKVKDHPFAQDEDYAIEDAYDRDLFFHDSGVSKIVLIPVDNQEKFVIKVPFHDYWGFSSGGYCNGDYEEGDYDFIAMSNAINPVTDTYTWDYCDREVGLYQVAKERGIDRCFPTTAVYCEDPYPIYVQEKCVEVYSNLAPKEINYSDDEYYEIKDHFPINSIKRNYLNSFNSVWVVNFVEWYSLDVLKQFLDFLVEFEISDLHSGNYGYSAIDNRPVIIDFAGFAEDEA